MEDKPNKPGNSAFKQQRLRGWRCSPSYLTLGIIYLGSGLFFIILGSVIIAESYSIVEKIQRYDDIKECKANWKTPPTCILDIKIDSHMSSPIFLYYEITNMYQNHRKYFKSRDIYQLMGYSRTKGEIYDSCTPVVTMEDLGFYTDLNLQENSPASPCGLMAKSYFNDTYTLIEAKTNENVHIKETGIAWPVDKDEKFKTQKDWTEKQWIDVEDEHFIVWMSTAGLPTFRKLWGKIDHDLTKGTYRIVIVNNYDVSSFNGQKRIILTTTTAFGGNISFLGVLYVIVGSVAMIGGGIMIATHLMKKRNEEYSNLI